MLGGLTFVELRFLGLVVFVGLGFFGLEFVEVALSGIGFSDFRFVNFFVCFGFAGLQFHKS